VAAIRSGELGLKTVVVEKDPFLGGPVCTSVYPTQVLLHHAEFTIISKMARNWGI